jgi:hypothetical protein
VLIQNICSGIRLQGRPQKTYYNGCSTTEPNFVPSKKQIKHMTPVQVDAIWGTLLGEGTEAIKTATMVFRQACC